MPPVDRRKLRGHYHTLVGQLRVFEDSKYPNIGEGVVTILGDAIQRLQADVPDAVPPFDQARFFSHRSSGTAYYDVAAIRAYVAGALGNLKALLEQQEDTTSPVTQTRDFSWIGEPRLRQILERDYQEIQRAFVAQCWKAVIILSGSAIEAVMTDLLLKNSTAAKASAKAPKGDIESWGLADLTKVAVDLTLVSDGVERLSEPVRRYRNLVHPGREVTDGLRFGQEEARIAFEVLNIVHRDLSP